MKKNVKFIIIFSILIFIYSFIFSCAATGQQVKSEEAKAIEAVKNSLTTEISGNWKVVGYEDGYVVNFDDIAFWYVEGGRVWGLNGFAKTYAQNTEFKYGEKFDLTNWEDLF